MPLGPGKYDEETQAAMVSIGASVTLLIVIDGRNGDGFEMAIDASRVDPARVLASLPILLRKVASQIERDNN